MQQDRIETAGFTGSIPLDPINYGGYASTVEGANYVIGGNILIGPQVLTAMRTAFESTNGDLTDKLMHALRAAGQIVGADERCLSSGTSSASAYLRVAQPTDGLNQPSLNLHDDSIRQGVDPVERVYQQYLAIRPVTPKFSVHDVSVNEAERTALITVTLSEASPLSASVGIHTRALGSAMAGSDFYGFTRRLDFAPGVTSRTLNVSILDDLLAESDESFGLRLYNASGGEIEDDLATVTIVDDDSAEPVRISISDLSVSENAGDLEVFVMLSAPAAELVTVGLHTRAGTAIGGQDYYGFTRTIRFEPGSTRQTTTLHVVDDNISESPVSEVLKLRLYNASGAVIARVLTTVTITDDD